MTTPRLPIDDLQRPGARLNRAVELIIGCPLCRIQPTLQLDREVKVHRRGLRWHAQCVRCQFKFSMTNADLRAYLTTPDPDTGRPRLDCHLFEAAVDHT